MPILYIKNENGEFIGVPSIKGEAGYSPIISENLNNTEDIYKLDIDTKASSFSTPNLKGTDGESAYEIALKNNFEGSEEEWLDSLQGESGVYIGEEEPTNPDYTVWINPNGSPNHGLTEADKQEIIDRIKEEYDNEVMAILGGG